MPKCGTHSVNAWLEANGLPYGLGHAPASSVARRYPGSLLWGVLRDRDSWALSWFRHVTRAGPENERARNALKAYGRGRVDVFHVLQGMHELDLVADYLDRGRRRWDLLPEFDPLLNPMGRNPQHWIGTLHARTFDHMFRDKAGRMLVDVLVPLDRLEQGVASIYGLTAVGIPHLNAHKDVNNART